MTILPTPPSSPIPPMPQKKSSIEGKRHFDLPEKHNMMIKPERKVYELGLNRLMPGTENVKTDLPLHEVRGKIAAMLMDGETLAMKNKDHEIDEAIKAFADAFIASIRDEYRNPLETFDVYSKRLHAQIVTDTNKYRERFAKGYQVIVNELKKQKEGKGKS